MTLYKVIRELCITHEMHVEAESPGEAETRASYAIARQQLGRGEWRTKDIIRLTPRRGAIEKAEGE